MKPTPESLDDYIDYLSINSDLKRTAYKVYVDHYYSHDWRKAKRCQTLKKLALQWLHIDSTRRV